MKVLFFRIGKLFFPFACLLFLLTTSCDDDFGTQCFDNKTREPVDIYIDGFYELTIERRDETCIFLGEGCFDWYVEGVDTGNFLEGTICLGPDSFETTIVIDD